MFSWSFLTSGSTHRDLEQYPFQALLDLLLARGSVGSDEESPRISNGWGLEFPSMSGSGSGSLLESLKERAAAALRVPVGALRMQPVGVLRAAHLSPHN